MSNQWVIRYHIVYLCTAIQPKRGIFAFDKSLNSTSPTFTDTFVGQNSGRLVIYTMPV